MDEGNARSGHGSSTIQCVEVLIPENYITGAQNNIFWTLSVYSLQNQPVKKDRSIPGSEIFHFMVYDWQRTIERLLNDNKIPYSLIAYFNANSIYSAPEQNETNASDNEIGFLKALSRLPEDDRLDATVAKMLSHTSPDRKADLLPL